MASALGTGLARAGFPIQLHRHLTIIDGSGTEHNIVDSLLHSGQLTVASHLTEHCAGP